MKMIFQDPISSLNPRRKVEDIIAEGLRIWKIGTDEEQQTKVDEVMLARRPRSRRCSAAAGRTSSPAGSASASRSRARSITEPKLIICDEPVSALDVSVQAQILNLLEDMKARYGLTLIFIAHDLAVVKNVSDRVVVMYLGKICEVGPPDALYKQPAHPYTAGAARGDPGARPERASPRSAPALAGEIPSPVAPPSGCRFRTRCPKAQDVCAAEEPRDPRGRARPVRRVPLPARAGRDARRPRNGPAPLTRALTRQLRGRPRMRWARMFLFTWVVPPAIVSARL